MLPAWRITIICSEKLATLMLLAFDSFPVGQGCDTGMTAGGPAEMTFAIV